MDTCRMAKAREAKTGEEGRRNPEERCLDDPSSRTKAIHAFCFQCVGRNSGYQSDIRGCTSKNCPLYLFRPYK